MARKRKYDDIKEIEVGDNTKFLTHTLRFTELPRIDLHDPEQLRERCLLYLQTCAMDDVKPSLEELAVACRTTKSILHNIPYDKSYSRDVKQLYDDFKQVLEAQMVHWFQNGKVNPAAAIFILKNNYGWRDVVDIEVAPRDLLGDIAPEDEIRQKYLADLPTYAIEDLHSEQQKTMAEFLGDTQEDYVIVDDIEE